MLAKIFSGTTIGIRGIRITVEVDVAKGGFPSLKIVGLPHKSIEEAKERVRTAIINSDFQFPQTRVVINLSPADIPKEGSHFDVPIAVGVLIAHKKIHTNKLKNCLFVGELSLDGKVLSVPGILPITTHAKKCGIKNVFVPEANAREAALISNINVYGIQSLHQLSNHLGGTSPIPRQEPVTWSQLRAQSHHIFDFKDVKDQEKAKRALEIAAAGGHNVLLNGPPGTGKTMLARSFPSIMPELQESDVTELSNIYSVTHKFRDRKFVVDRPFRSPHHTVSRIGLIGGGQRLYPGEITLAHRGVLFLDEFPEYPRSVIESLRQPLEDGVVTITRATGTVTYPSRFILIAAANPCPCGYLGHQTKPCDCNAGQITRYKKKISGPLLDRIDIHVNVPPVKEEAIAAQNDDNEFSESIRIRVSRARNIQQARVGQNKKPNSELSTADIKNICILNNDARQLLSKAYKKFSLSARSYFKIIKVSQTIADLQNQKIISAPMVSEALQYRPLHF